MFLLPFASVVIRMEANVGVYTNSSDPRDLFLHMTLRTSIPMVMQMFTGFVSFTMILMPIIKCMVLTRSTSLHVPFYFLQWVSHRNHRGNICGVDFIWLCNPNRSRKSLKSSWAEAVFGIIKMCQVISASITVFYASSLV